MILNKIPLASFTILLILPLVTMNAFGEASLELKSYSTAIAPNGNVLIIGKISGATPYIPVKLTISDPSGKTIYSPNVEFDGNGNFKYLVKPTLPQFSLGTYTVEATHRDLVTPVQFQFEVQTGGTVDRPTCTGNQLDVKGYCVPYSVTGASVSSSSLDTKQKSIVIMLSNSDNGGTLNLKPSADIIKGISRVQVDGQDWDNVIINKNDVTIMFPAGAQKIEVIGTFVIPEFGPIAIIILGMSIIGIIFMTGRYKLLEFPKI